MSPLDASFQVDRCDNDALQNLIDSYQPQEQQTVLPEGNIDVEAFDRQPPHLGFEVPDEDQPGALSPEPGSLLSSESSFSSRGSSPIPSVRETSADRLRELDELKESLQALWKELHQEARFSPEQIFKGQIKYIQFLLRFHSLLQEFVPLDKSAEFYPHAIKKLESIGTKKGYLFHVGRKLYDPQLLQKEVLLRPSLPSFLQSFLTYIEKGTRVVEKVALRALQQIRYIFS